VAQEVRNEHHALCVLVPALERDSDCAANAGACLQRWRHAIDNPDSYQ
jgi:hypothetical protein